MLGLGLLRVRQVDPWMTASFSAGLNFNPMKSNHSASFQVWFLWKFRCLKHFETINLTKQNHIHEDSTILYPNKHQWPLSSASGFEADAVIAARQALASLQGSERRAGSSEAEDGELSFWLFELFFVDKNSSKWANYRILSVEYWSCCVFSNGAQLSLIKFQEDPRCPRGFSRHSGKLWI